MYTFWLTILIFIGLFIVEIVEGLLWCFRVKLNDKYTVEGLLEFPSCLNSTDLDNHIKEEEIIRGKLGYKKMFDSTLRKFKLTWDASDQIDYW